MGRAGANLAPTSRCDVAVKRRSSTEIKKYEEQYHAIEIPNEESVVTYFKIRQQLAKLGKEIQEFIQKPKYCLPFLQPGRLVKVRQPHVTSSLKADGAVPSLVCY